MALPEVPFRAQVLEGMRQLLTRDWVRYLQAVADIVNNTARQIALASKTAQGAAISATALETGSLDPGVYRVSYAARITRAASTSSSLTVTLGWTDGAVAQTQSGAAMTGNTTATAQNLTILAHVDQNTTVTYAAAYASSGGTSMQYSLYVLAEKIG